MDKIARRLAQAERRVARRSTVISRIKARDDRRERLRQQKQIRQSIYDDIKDARRALRDQWELGSLAPRRDLADGSFGSMDANRQSGGIEIPAPALKRRCAWAGGPNKLNLVAGDRVAIMDGPDRGKVDRVTAVDPVTGTVTLKNLHRTLTRLPPWFIQMRSRMKGQGQLGDAPEAFLDATVRAAPIPISAVRLVYPLEDPRKPGTYRDVIVRELVAVPASFDDPARLGIEDGDGPVDRQRKRDASFKQWEYGRRWDRMIPGLNVRIPWPEPEVPNHETHPADTVRSEVERVSFVPTLLKPPMPDAVLAELRNPYSKFRTRHEPWWVAKKEAEAVERKLKHLTRLEMRTPLQDFHQQQREMRRARGQPALTDDMLEMIGQMMERNRLADIEVGEANVAAGTTTTTSSSSGGAGRPGVGGAGSGAEIGIAGIIRGRRAGNHAVVDPSLPPPSRSPGRSSADRRSRP